MKLSHITTAIFVSASAILSAQAQAQTISVTPQTLIMNFAPGENLLARLAQPNPGQVSAIETAAPTAPAPPASVPVPVAAPTAPVAPVSAPVAPQAAPATPVVPSAPVDVPSVIGGQKMGVDAQRVTRCLIEHHGDRYICGMLELNGEISKCVGGVGTPGGCFTAPLTHVREVGVQPRPRPHNYYRINNYRVNNFRTYANSINFF